MSSPVPAAEPSLSPDRGARPRRTMAGLAGLTAVRAELDRIDDAVHDLLMQPAEVVARLASSAAAVGGPGSKPLRAPAAARTGGSHHPAAAGAAMPAPLPRQALVRHLARAAGRHDGNAGRAGRGGVRGRFRRRLRPDGARAFRRADAAARISDSPGPPGGGEPRARPPSRCCRYRPIPSAPRDAWWTKLLQNDPPRLHVIARLPFWRPRGRGVAGGAGAGRRRRGARPERARPVAAGAGS